MDDGTRGLLWFVAAQSVFIAALIHLVLGVTNWLRWIQGGFLFPRDVRWPVFVVSAVVILVGLYVASFRDDRRPFYVGGILAMAGYAGGYFVWHLTGHRPLLVLGNAAGTETVSVQWFLDHLFGGLVEFTSIFFEVVAIVALAVLLVTEDAPAEEVTEGTHEEGESGNGNTPDDTADEETVDER
jgi:hypothetical protein